MKRIKLKLKPYPAWQPSTNLLLNNWRSIYSKGLAKVSAKVFKAAKESNGGTVSNAWHFVAEDMEATADTHKSIANLLVEEIVKPLKMFAEAQHRTRKSVESLLEKGRVQRSTY